MAFGKQRSLFIRQQLNDFLVPVGTSRLLPDVLIDEKRIASVNTARGCRPNISIWDAVDKLTVC